MAYKEITVTSKNQITIPSAFAEELKISKGMVLTANIQGNKIILTQPMSLSSCMKQFWGKRAKNVHLNDDELKSAIRKSATKRALLK